MQGKGRGYRPVAFGSDAGRSEVVRPEARRLNAPGPGRYDMAKVMRDVMRVIDLQ